MSASSSVISVRVFIESKRCDAVGQEPFFCHATSRIFLIVRAIGFEAIVGLYDSKADDFPASLLYEDPVTWIYAM